MILQENNGKSPVLPEGIKNYLIDIDGTITEDVPNEDPSRMESCLPFDDAVAIIKKMVCRRAHYHLFYFSDRGDERNYNPVAR